jgi:hypothetical protein
MVAPSFVIMTSPSGLTNILSIPFGPNDVFKRLATVLAANILIYNFKNYLLKKRIIFKIMKYKLTIIRFFRN